MKIRVNSQFNIIFRRNQLIVVNHRFDDFNDFSSNKSISIRFQSIAFETISLYTLYLGKYV